MNHTNFALIITGIVVAFVLLLSFLFSQRPTVNDEWFHGKTTARWQITEYADLECPFCREYTPKLKEWVSQQPNIKLRWHHFQLQGHGTMALYEARLVQCAGKLGGAEEFWRAIDLVLEHSKGNGRGVNLDFEHQSLDINPKAFACATNDKVIAKDVDQQLTIAKSRGVVATPTIEVTDTLTGHSVRLEGPVDGNALLSAIDALAAHNIPHQE